MTKHVERELLVHRRCAAHPFILNLLDVFLVQSYMVIVLENASGGDLQVRYCYLDATACSLFDVSAC